MSKLVDSAKKFGTDLKNNTNGIRKQAAIALGVLAAAVISGIVVSRLQDDNVPVLILSEAPQPVAVEDVPEF